MKAKFLSIKGAKAEIEDVESLEEAIKSLTVDEDWELYPNPTNPSKGDVFVSSDSDNMEEQEYSDEETRKLLIH